MMKRSFRAASFLLAVIILPVLAGCTPGPAEEAFTEAESLFAAGQYRQAQSLYTDLLKDHPESPRAPASLYRSASISVLTGESEEALITYAKLIYLYPQSDERFQAASDMAAIYSSIGKHWSAIERYNWLLLNDSKVDKELIGFRIAGEHMEMGDLDSARSMLKEILADKADSALAPDIYFMLANIYYLEGSYGEAIAAYDDVVRLFPKNPLSLEARLGKAVSLDGAGSLAEAIEILKELVEVYPNPEAIRIRLKWVEGRLKKKG